MKRLLIFVFCLCTAAGMKATIYHNGIVTKVGDNYYTEFWDDEDESDDVRVELRCYERMMRQKDGTVRKVMRF